MLRTEVTVGGCCWAVETTIRRSLFYEVNAKILCFCGQRSHPQIFTGRSRQAKTVSIIKRSSQQEASSFLLRSQHAIAFTTGRENTSTRLRRRKVFIGLER